MTEIDDELQRRFPKMKRMKGSPPMTTINGIGTSLYGSRDYDADTQTYVKTLCLTVLFAPLWCFKSYRVMKADQGWYFIGKEPISMPARMYNLLILALIATGIVLIQYNIRTSSPEYIAEQQMKAAQQQIEKGQLAEAAKTCQTVLASHTPQWDNARAAMDDIVHNRCQTAPLTESVKVYETAIWLSRSGKWSSPADVAEKGLKLASARGATDPRSGVALLELIRPLVIDTRPVDDASLPLLKQWVAAEPANLDAVVPLAAILDEQKKPDEAKALLMPVRATLGTTEGARVLGGILAHDGDYDGAYALLQPYVDSRLASLREAESNWDSTLKSLWDRELQTLRDNEGPADFYNRYEAATEDRKDGILQEYVNGRMKNDPEYTAAQQAMAQQAKVVPVALDLGIIMLQRAQQNEDPAARKTQLEAAEKVFLAIGGVAGESDTYRVTLGQVKYWLGKQDEGRKLFDEYLASNERAVEALLAIAGRYRELGANPDARKLAEEAYGKASTKEERFGAASLRALVETDDDDEIAWLKKADTSSPTVKAQLSQSEGDKAVAEGRDKEAVEHYKATLDAYAAMPRSATTLNQSAIAHFSIFSMTGDSAQLQQCIDKFQQALELMPSDPILLYNAGGLLLDGSLTEIAGKTIDLRALKMTGSTGSLGALYNDPQGRAAVVKQVVDHPGIARGLSYMEKAAILAPKNGKAFRYLDMIHRFTRNAPAMTNLRARMRESEMDTSDQLRVLKEHLAGTRDDQAKAASQANLDRLEKAVTRLRPAGGATAAVAISQLASALHSQRIYTGKTDADRIIALYDEAFRLAPSAMTESPRRSAHLLRVAEQIAGKDAAFAAHLKAHERSTGIAYLVAVAATEPGPFRQKIVAHPDFVRAVELTKQDMARMADPTAFDWALLSALDAGEAGQAADLIRKEPRRQVENDIDLLLSPYSVGDAIDAYWLSKIYRTSGDGRVELKRIAAAEVPVPLK